MTITKNITSRGPADQSPNDATQSSIPSLPELPTSPKMSVIPASHGLGLPLRSGTHFRLLDFHGSQVIDMSAFCLPLTGTISATEHLSPSYTLYHTGGQPITIGECVYTNMDNPLLRLVGDTVKTHDMTFMSCFPKMYEDLGLPGHRSCAQNMLEAFTPYGMKSLTEVRDPFNVFQNTPNYTLKPLNCSRKGDWCEWEVLKDCVVGWSCCPYDVGGFNGGEVTDVGVVTGIVPKRKGECSDWKGEI